MALRTLRLRFLKSLFLFIYMLSKFCKKITILSNNKESTSSRSHYYRSDQQFTLVTRPERLLLYLRRLSLYSFTFFRIYYAILSNLAVFFTINSTFYSRCRTFSILSLIIPCRFYRCFISTYFLSWSLLLLKKVWISRKIQIAAYRSHWIHSTYRKLWLQLSPL